ncbi:hypothetical protein ACFL96_05040 [Thermoproteota archaeon]
MKIKRWMNSEYCYALLKIKIEYAWVEQLKLLGQVSEMKNTEELIKTLLGWQLLIRKEDIERQKQENIKEEKELEEHRKLWYDNDV